MRSPILALAVISLAGAACAAAAQTTTDCYAIGSTYHCTTNSPLPSSGVNIDWRLAQPQPNFATGAINAYEAGRAMAAERAAAEATARAQAAETRTAELELQNAAQARATPLTPTASTYEARAASLERSERIGKMAHDGKCADAMKVATEDPGDPYLRVQIAIADTLCPGGEPLRPAR